MIWHSRGTGRGGGGGDLMESGDGDLSAMKGGGGGGVDLSESGDAESDGGEKGDEDGRRMRQGCDAPMWSVSGVFNRNDVPLSSVAMGAGPALFGECGPLASQP